jgi:endonuclease/exonuclease/phosphatase family metal-dependent hydrolase
VQLFDNYKIVLNQKPATLTVPPSQEHIRIITYNTQMMPSVAGAVDHLNQPKVRVKDIPVTVQNADVVVMQELFDPGLRETMLETMIREYPYNTLVVGDDSSKMLTGGVMIFSRWPIETEDQIVFKAGSGMDALAAKGVSYARINKNGFIFHVFGTHLQSGTDDAKTREQQLEEMRNFMLAKNIPVTQPVFLAGDFNIIEGSNEESELNSLLNVQDVENIGYPYSVDALTNGMSTSNDRAKIDYIFAQKDHRQPVLAYANVWVNRALSDEKMWPQFELSDHYPVTGDFYF